MPTPDPYAERLVAVRATGRAFRLSVVPTVAVWLGSLMWAPQLLRALDSLYDARSAATALVVDAVVLLLFVLGRVASQGLAEGRLWAPAMAWARAVAAVPGVVLGLAFVMGGGGFLVASISSSDAAAVAGGVAWVVIALACFVGEALFLNAGLRVWAARRAFAGGGAEPRSTGVMLGGATLFLLAAVALQIAANDAPPPPPAPRTHDPAGDSWGWGGR